MIRIRVLIVMLAALAVAASAPARDVVVEGTVLDAGSGAPLPGAQVSISGTSVGTLTGSDGSYRLTVPASAVSGGEVVVRVALIGYSSASERVSPEPGATSVRVDFRLQPAPISLEALTVTGDEALGQASRRASFSRAMAPATPLAAGSHHLPPGYNREGYAHIEENTFLDAQGNPLSTFGVDVDRASYANTRRFITQGQRPPRDAVRIEELVNYFDYDYADPAGDDPFSVTTALVRAPWQPEHYLLRIGLKAPAVDVSDLPPNNLVFLLDVSGSMRSPDKLPLVKRAMGLLVD